ncbi:cellulose binding domain-containing protein [Nocardiopsis ansamitocini]|uniref:CBM2 domain-containing protein n=1 Tax=Nocardiopsis ansamitocini TaxID=1670832 RepID=A0A9W6P3W1_9ACTN|nr:cellulose binding domain-containing protein [Nocardiopsis ansamitocini]GLU46617.1 hypothetical protein Nans01_09680 [Nocardiopsis ansamitocini]
MGRHGVERPQRGAHRAEQPDGGALTTVGQVLGSTVPKRVPPPRPFRVLLLSGVTVTLILFAYSTTQIYLRFTESPSGPGAPAPESGAVGGSPGSEALPSRGPEPGSSLQAEISAEVSQSPEAEERETEEEGADEPERQDAPEPPVAVGGTQVSYDMVPHSSNNFTGSVTIVNNGTSAIDGWELRLGFSGANITAAWNGDWESTGEGIVVRQPSWTGGIAPGESAVVNFSAEGSAQAPSSCSLNGRSCGL